MSAKENGGAPKKPALVLLSLILVAAVANLLSAAAERAVERTAS